MESDSADWPDICLYVYGEAWSWAARDDWVCYVPEDFSTGSLVWDLPVDSLEWVFTSSRLHCHAP